MKTQNNETETPKERESAQILERTLKTAASDSYVLAMIFAIIGVADILGGTSLMAKILGGIMLFLSYLNFQQGSFRYSLGKVFESKD